MGTIRVSHNKNYTCIHNQAIRDKKLSFKARGIHHLLLSFPDDWIVNISHLINQSEHDGRDAIRSGLIELERQGYLVRNQSRNQKGQFDKAAYTIFEFPIEDLPDRENPATETRRREAGDGKSDPIINNDLRSNDLNEVLRDKVLIFPEETEKKEPPTISVEVIDLDPDRADGKEQIESVYPSELISNLIPCQEPEILEEDKSSAARNTLAKRSVTDGVFGSKQSSLGFQKKRAIAATIKLGEFESQEEQKEFFGAAIDQMLKDNPKLSSGQAQKDANWMIARLSGEGNLAKKPQDEIYLALFRSRQLGNVSFEAVKQVQSRKEIEQQLKQWSVTGD